MGRKSAGLLVYKESEDGLLFFLVHPGGPYWQQKDTGAWSIPKGEFTDDEDPLSAARREFGEETGQVMDGVFTPLHPIKQKSGKTVYAWAVEGEVDADNVVSNTIKLEWPYKSGKWMTVPEVDKGGWFGMAEAMEKINPAQVAFLSELLQYLKNEEAI